MLFFYIRKWAQLANLGVTPSKSSAEWLPASARPMSNSLTSFSVVQKAIAALAVLALLNVATILTYFIRDQKKSWVCVSMSAQNHGLQWWGTFKRYMSNPGLLGCIFQEKPKLWNFLNNSHRYHWLIISNCNKFRHIHFIHRFGNY